MDDKEALKTIEELTLKLSEYFASLPPHYPKGIGVWGNQAIKKLDKARGIILYIIQYPPKKETNGE